LGVIDLVLVTVFFVILYCCAIPSLGLIEGVFLLIALIEPLISLEVLAFLADAYHAPGTLLAILVIFAPEIDAPWNAWVGRGPSLTAAEQPCEFRQHPGLIGAVVNATTRLADRRHGLNRPGIFR
jgi:hypothetical protein